MEIHRTKDGFGVADYIQLFYEKLYPKKEYTSSCVRGEIIFRGLPNSDWEIISSAGRRLLNEGKDKTEQDDFIRYHINLIDNARKFGYGGLELNTQLNDLEILAEIQHYGGATCLVDFTTNLLIALWFATEKCPEIEVDKEKNIKTIYKDTDSDGKIYWLDLQNEKDFNRISYYNEYRKGDSLEGLLTKVTSSFIEKDRVLQPRFWFWKPKKLNNRIIKQDSAFLFGLQALKNDSQLDGEKYKLDFKELPVYKEHKNRIRSELQYIFGISSETVYYDISGYALNANGAEAKINETILPQKDCLTNTKECIRREQYSAAIKYINEALRCKKDNSDYQVEPNVRKCSIRPIQGSQDQDKQPVDCSPEIGELLFWRALANYRMKNYDEALFGYHEASKSLEGRLKGDDNQKYYKLYCECYRKSSNIHYIRSNYIDAYKISNELYNISEPNFNTEDATKDRDNGKDALLSLIELSIMRLKKDDFSCWVNKAQVIFKGYFKDDSCSLNDDIEKLNNGVIIFKLLKELGFAIFEKQINYLEIINELEKYAITIIKKIGTKSERSQPKLLLGYYYWDYSDLSKWINSLRKRDYDSLEPTNQNGNLKKFIIDNSDKLILIIQKGQEVQDRLINKVFAVSAAVRDESNKKK